MTSILYADYKALIKVINASNEDTLVHKNKKLIILTTEVEVDDCAFIKLLTCFLFFFFNKASRNLTPDFLSILRRQTMRRISEEKLNTK